MTSIALTSIGVIVGGITLNPIILGTVSSCGLLVQGYVNGSKLADKVEKCKFAYTSYKKVLTQITTYLHGLPYDEETFLVETKVLDDIVTDTCPPVNGAIEKYNKTYSNINNVYENKKTNVTNKVYDTPV